MTISKEIVAGAVFLFCAIAGIYLAAGWPGLGVTLITVVIARTALHLFNKKSKLAKAGGVILYSDLLLTFLMPKSSRAAIHDLEEAEKKKSLDE